MDHLKVLNTLEKIADDLDLDINRTRARHAAAIVYKNQIVSYGELMSTKILNEYLNLRKFNSILLDARDIVKTDSKYQNAKIDWSSTEKNIKKTLY